MTRPQGPFSDPYRGRTDFNQITISAIGSKDAPFPRPVLLTTYDERHETPLTYNWNLTLEREFFPEWLARMAYVGSSSMYGRITKQLNPALPSAAGFSDARRLFAPELGNIEYFDQDRRANYHSMQLSMTKRFSQNYTVLANYTWARGMGNYFGETQVSGSTYGEVVPWNIPDADLLMYGPMEFDHRHRVVASWVWDLPKMNTDRGALKKLLHGWQLSGVGQYQTGAPYNVRSGRDNSGTGRNNDRARLTGTGPEPVGGSDKRVWFNPAAFAVNIPGTFGSIGTGAFYGPHLCSFDMGFFKNTQITEGVSVQFRAEMFNIFNQTNFDNPSSNLSGADFGRIVQTNRIAGDPRIIQFGLKILF